MSASIAPGQIVEAPDLLQLTMNIVDGSVYQPGATFKNDQTTGLYRDYQTGILGVVYKQDLQMTFGSTGPLLSAPPSDPMGIANKQYVDEVASGFILPALGPIAAILGVPCLVFSAPKETINFLIFL